MEDERSYARVPLAQDFSLEVYNEDTDVHALSVPSPVAGLFRILTVSLTLFVFLKSAAD